MKLHLTCNQHEVVLIMTEHSFLLCDENLYVEVNMYVTLYSDTEVT